jgi:hypothetical protein
MEYAQAAIVLIVTLLIVCGFRAAVWTGQAGVRNRCTLTGHPLGL